MEIEPLSDLAALSEPDAEWSEETETDVDGEKIVCVCSGVPEEERERSLLTDADQEVE